MRSGHCSRARRTRPQRASGRAKSACKQLKESVMTILDHGLAAPAPLSESTPNHFVTAGSRGSNAHPFARFPFTPFWVFLSGKEILGRKRAWEPQNWHYLAAALTWLAVG